MADVENQQESSFPVKRKTDLYCQDQDNVANKAQKLEPSTNSADSESKDGEISGIGVENLNSSSTEEKIVTESEKDENGVAGDLGAEEEEEDEDDDDEEEEEEVDRKGKGISREDKGKGKMIEVEESDDEDDSDDELGEEDDESDLSDDPLAEVDLDNILPTRTRRRSTQPGVYISNKRAGNIEDDDSSDDSDA